MILGIIIFCVLGTVINICYARKYIDLTIADIFACLLVSLVSPIIFMLIITNSKTIIKKKERK